MDRINENKEYARVRTNKDCTRPAYQFHVSCIDVYKRQPEGTIIMYTRNREYVKQFAVKSNFRILKEIKITQRPESYLMILK